MAKTFATYSLATKYAQESEANIEKGLFADLAEANQTLSRDAWLTINSNRTANFFVIS